jgi:hypothetical protein
LVADGSAGIRPYRVARLSKVRVLEEPARRPSGFDLATLCAQSLAEYEASRPQIQVQVRIARAALPELERVLAPRDRAALREAAGAADGADWLTLSVPFERSEHAHRDLLGLGEHVESWHRPSCASASERAPARWLPSMPAEQPRRKLGPERSPPRSDADRAPRVSGRCLAGEAAALPVKSSQSHLRQICALGTIAGQAYSVCRSEPALTDQQASRRRGCVP